MIEKFIGIDLGTSSVKVLAVDCNGKVYGGFAEDYRVERPESGFAEQNMELLWKAAENCIKKLVHSENVKPEEIKGIGFSGQMHGLVPLDGNGKPVCNAIIWEDQRSEIQVDELKGLGLEEIVLNSAGTGFMLTSLLWLKEKEPENYQKIKKVLLPKDYIRYRICGELGTDQTDASGSLLFDNRKREWSANVLEMAGIDPFILPECHKSYETAGYVTEECAGNTGLCRGTVVVYGGGDQQMQAVGNRMIVPSVFSSNIGTGSQISCIVNQPFFDTRFRTNTFCFVEENQWTVMGASLNGGAAFKWLKENFFMDDTFDECASLAKEVNAGSNGLIFLPYLSGERCPHMDSKAKGILFGLTMKHGKAHMIRAVMEGVVYALKESLEIINEMGIECERIIASGGGAKNSLWLQLQADMYRQAVYTAAVKEQACLGAAVMAALGSGIYRNLDEACRNMVQWNESVVYPDKKNAAIYEENFGLYKELYRKNRELF